MNESSYPRAGEMKPSVIFSKVQIKNMRRRAWSPLSRSSPHYITAARQKLESSGASPKRVQKTCVRWIGPDAEGEIYSASEKQSVPVI